ncbi:MAG: guanylate kinase [Clostridia bacterium]|jgi:guanylate kinase|nr:guanylate kinase [Clostridia bacterium]
MKNLLIVLSGPSGVGKGTIVNKLLQDGGYSLSVSCTTRPPRVGEVDGKSYFFITKEKFSEMIAQGGFLEYSNHFENFYGTPKGFVTEQLKTHDVILEIEVDGALQVKKAHPEALLIMILPPDEAALIARLKGRGTESDEKIAARVDRMRYEASKKHLYDFIVVNDDLNTAVEEIKSIIKSRKEI